jgi:hypothetical protein
LYSCSRRRQGRSLPTQAPKRKPVAVTLQSGRCLRRHNTHAIHSGRVGDVDHFGNLLEAQLVVAPDKEHTLRAIGVDCFKARRQFRPGYGLPVDPEGRFIPQAPFRTSRTTASGWKGVPWGAGFGAKVTSPREVAGTITMKMMSRTNRTSIIGVILISDVRRRPAGSSIDMAQVPFSPCGGTAQERLEAY